MNIKKTKSKDAINATINLSTEIPPTGTEPRNILYLKIIYQVVGGELSDNYEIDSNLSGTYQLAGGVDALGV